MKTLKQWNKRNRLVKKGSKAKGFTKSGKALFKKKQTHKNENSYYIYDSFKDYNGTNWDQNTDECDEHQWLDPLNY